MRSASPYPVHAHLFGHDQRLGFGARFGQSAFGEQKVKTSFWDGLIGPSSGEMNEIRPAIPDIVGKEILGEFQVIEPLHRRNQAGRLHSVLG